MSDIMTEILDKKPIAHEAIAALRNMDFETPCVKTDAERLPAVEALELYSPQLHELSQRALAPNLLYEGSVLAPALEFLNDNSDHFEVILAWQNPNSSAGVGSPDKRLVGWLVVHHSTALPGIGPSYLRSWNHLYSYLGHPIVDRDNAEAALVAIFDLALAHPGTSGPLMMSNVPGAGPIYDAIIRVVKDKNLLSCEIGRHQRAAMNTTLSAEEYLASALSNKKRKEFRRLKNRLSDLGDLKFETCRADEAISSWVEDFIYLEAIGWKGRQQTAFGNRKNWVTFLKASTTNLAANGQCKIWRLTLEGKTIAITIVHHVGHQAWLTKITYDEAYAKYSPGVLLVLEVTKVLADDPEIAEIDSLAAPDHPMINHLWRQRISSTDILIANNQPVAKLGFALTCRLIEVRRKIREVAKLIYYRYLKGASR